MRGRIIHFGVDIGNRIAPLKDAGYRVDECRSLAQLHAALVGILAADAVAVTDNDGGIPQGAISLIRATSIAPLILFQNDNHRHNSAEFDLVVPSSIEARDWLSSIAEVMARSVQRDR
jgi:hypothetical protein